MFGNTQFAPQIGAHGDDFGIHIRAFKTQGFHAHLVKLTVAPFLRPLAAEHRPHIPQLLRTVVEQVVLHHRTQARGGAFRAQAQAVVGIGKGVHFLAHHIGVFADGAHKQAGLLHNRGADLAIAETARPAAHAVFKCLPKGGGEFKVFLRLRQQIVHAFNGLDFLAHIDNVLFFFWFFGDAMMKLIFCRLGFVIAIAHHKLTQ